MHTNVMLRMQCTRDADSCTFRIEGRVAAKPFAFASPHVHPMGKCAKKKEARCGEANVHENDQEEDQLGVDDVWLLCVFTRAPRGPGRG